MRVLLVEDDKMLGAALCEALRDAAFAVDWVTDGAMARAALRDPVFALVLLDLGLPQCDGLDVLRLLRAEGNKTPVIIVTARDNTDDCIRGLDLGADDYLNKPFEVGELLARMRAALRRSAGQAAPQLRSGAVALDPATRRAHVDEVWHTLSAREYQVMLALMVQPGRVLSRRELEERVYGWGEEVESNVIEFIIHGLRKKLGPTVIRNVRGLGWMVVDSR